MLVMNHLHLIEREQISLLIMKEWGNRLRSYNNTMQFFNATFRRKYKYLEIYGSQNNQIFRRKR